MVRNLGTSLAFTGSGSVNSTNWIPKRTSRHMRCETTPTRAGTVQVFRLDHNGTTLVPHGAAIPVTANVTDVQDLNDINMPVVITFTDTSTSAGTCTFRGIETEA